MQKHKKTLGALMLAGMMVLNVGVTAQADTKMEVDTTVTSENGVAPCFIAIWDCGRALRLENSWGKMYIYGYTDTYPEYTSGVKVELQQKNGSSWTTIETWEDAQGSTDSTVGLFYYVDRGTYRTKVTHTAYNASGAEVETFEANSDEVTY